MGAWAREVWSFVTQVVSEFIEDDCMSMAASLAYYTVFSLAPMVVIVIVAAGLVLSPEQATDAVNSQLHELIGAEGAQQVATMVAHVRSNPGGTIIARTVGTVVALFGATAVMVQLQAALNRAWDVKPDPDAGGAWNFVMKRLLSFAMILAIAFLLLVSLALSALLSAVAHSTAQLLPAGTSAWVPSLIDLSVSFVVVTLLFAAIFKVMPEAKIEWSDVALGAVVTAALFTIGKWGIGLYLGQSNVGSAYGGASSLAVLLIWVYYSSIILLLGAEFTQVYTRRYGGGLRPVTGAVIASDHEAGEIVQQAKEDGVLPDDDETEEEPRDATAEVSPVSAP